MSAIQKVAMEVKVESMSKLLTNQERTAVVFMLGAAGESPRAIHMLAIRS